MWSGLTHGQTLNDELLSLNLEISALSDRNAALQADNAQLLQRWLDKMNLTAEEMNDEFEREAVQGAGGGTPSPNDKKKPASGPDFRKGGKGT